MKVVDDLKRRACLGLPHSVEYAGGCSWFKLTPSRLRAAVLAGYADPAGRQNEAPHTADFLALADAMGGDGAPMDFLCYATSPDRPDCRVTVEGVMLRKEATEAARELFTYWCNERFPDEFDGYRAWWD